jgi:hypothetical protein
MNRFNCGRRCRAVSVDAGAPGALSSRDKISSRWSSRMRYSSLECWGGLLGEEIVGQTAEWQRLASELITESGKVRVVLARGLN